jgi:hypothetical protein
MKIRACKMKIGADQINLNVRCPKVCAADSRSRASRIADFFMKFLGVRAYKMFKSRVT